MKPRTNFCKMAHIRHQRIAILVPGDETNQVVAAVAQSLAPGL
jgi:hypothetical protein